MDRIELYSQNKWKMCYYVILIMNYLNVFNKSKIIYLRALIFNIHSNNAFTVVSVSMQNATCPGFSQGQVGTSQDKPGQVRDNCGTTRDIKY